MDISIVNLDMSNIFEVLNFRKKALAENPLAAHMYAEEDTLFPDLEHLEDFVHQYGKGFFLAEENGVIIGMARGRVEEYKLMRHNGWATSFYVAPELRGKGIGQLLLNSVLKFFKGNSHVKNVFLHVAESQKEAIALYKKNDFTVTGKLPFCFEKDGLYYDQVFMALTN